MRVNQQNLKKRIERARVGNSRAKSEYLDAIAKLAVQNIRSDIQRGIELGWCSQADAPRLEKEFADAMSSLPYHEKWNRLREIANRGN